MCATLYIISSNSGYGNSANGNVCVRFPTVFMVVIVHIKYVYIALHPGIDLTHSTTCIRTMEYKKNRSMCL